MLDKYFKINSTSADDLQVFYFLFVLNKKNFADMLELQNGSNRALEDEIVLKVFLSKPQLSYQEDILFKVVSQIIKLRSTSLFLF